MRTLVTVDGQTLYTVIYLRTIWNVRQGWKTLVKDRYIDITGLQIIFGVIDYLLTLIVFLVFNIS